MRRMLSTLFFFQHNLYTATNFSCSVILIHNYYQSSTRWPSSLSRWPSWKRRWFYWDHDGPMVFVASPMAMSMVLRWNGVGLRWSTMVIFSSSDGITMVTWFQKNTEMTSADGLQWEFIFTICDGFHFTMVSIKGSHSQNFEKIFIFPKIIPYI